MFNWFLNAWMALLMSITDVTGPTPLEQVKM